MEIKKIIITLIEVVCFLVAVLKIILVHVRCYYEVNVCGLKSRKHDEKADEIGD